jgi:drug/metabolite transporter (DMT)-like permease
VLHAGWNVLLGGARDVHAATTVTLVLAVLAFAPVAALTWDVDRAAVPWLVASSTLQLVYFALLVAAYRASDVSLVYPVARGAAPVLVLVVGLAFGEAVGTLQAVGVLVVAAGILLVRGTRGHAETRGIVLALAIAATIAGYTLVDNEGIEHADPIPYLETAMIPVALVALAYDSVTGKLGRVRAAVGPATVAAALASFGAYALVLAALTLAPAAAVAAVRESSVLVAVALGAAVLGEPVGRGRVVGATLVVAGVAFVALG